MSSAMERLRAALNGTQADRIPVFCNLLDQGARELGMTLEEYYANGEHVAEAQLNMLKKYGHDNVWGLFYVGKEAELVGCRKILFAKTGPPNVQDFVIKSYDDIAGLQIPADVASHPAFEQQLKCYRILKNEVGGKTPICAYATSSMTLPSLMMGMEHWMELLLTGPEEVRDELLTKCHDLFTREVLALRQCGVDVIIYSNPFGSTDFVPMSYFEKHSLPWIEKDIRAVGTEGIVYYCGMARLNDAIERVYDRTGIGAYYVSPLDDLGQAKRFLGERALTCGVINDIELIEWSRQEIEHEVKRILDIGMPGGRFLFGTGVMPFCIPEENIRTLLESAFKYGILSP